MKGEKKYYSIYVLEGDESTKGREFFEGWYDFDSKEKHFEAAAILHELGLHMVLNPNW